MRNQLSFSASAFAVTHETKARSSSQVLASSATSSRDTSEAPKKTTKAKAYLQHDPLAVMPISYDARFVILSILVAMLASYVALGKASSNRFMGVCLTAHGRLVFPAENV